MAFRVLVLDGSPHGALELPGPELERETCRLAREALETLRAGGFDLLIVELDVPDMPGLSFLRVLRDTDYGRELAVIAVTAAKSDDAVKQAFALGVDDFLVRPVDGRELSARVRAVLRRRLQRQEHWGAPLSLGGIEIDPSQRRCLVLGKRVALQPREFELLETLMRRAGRVLTRVYLLETVWGMAATAQTRAVDVMVSRLRRRLGRRARLIETVSKLGYCFRDPDAA